MGPCSSLRDKVVTDTAREGQIGDRAMQMPQFSSTLPEFNPAESMIVRRHTVPTDNRAANRFDRIVRSHDLIVQSGTVNGGGLPICSHDGFLSCRVCHQARLQVGLKSSATFSRMEQTVDRRPRTSADLSGSEVTNVVDHVPRTDATETAGRC
jgi:hypothetical protein